MAYHKQKTCTDQTLLERFGPERLLRVKRYSGDVRRKRGIRWVTHRRRLSTSGKSGSNEAEMMNAGMRHVAVLLAEAEKELTRMHLVEGAGATKLALGDALEATTEAHTCVQMIIDGETKSHG